jgi:formylglycine-generating enzyme required for sulfatase activity
MIAIPEGNRLIGSDRHYPEERPQRLGFVAAFALDVTPVTNAAFAAFVADTGYVTQAEQSGSGVFQMTSGPVPLSEPQRWWRFDPEASWRAPRGAGSSYLDVLEHPVTHVTQADAKAFAAWRGARLPTEHEWETAARLDHPEAEYAWGDAFKPAGQLWANVWTGSFPWYFAREGAPGPSAVGSYPASRAGFFDLIGNVWEWTSSRFDGSGDCGCAPPAVGEERLLTLKGGSHLCAGEYCARYRPAARIGVTAATSTSHIGFRCARTL